jgi:amino acid permease
VLGLPYALAYSGSVLGLILICTSCILGIFSLHILSICAKKVPPPSSFYSVTEASVPQMTFMIDLAVAIQCFGVCASYLIVIGGLMPEVMSQFGADGFWVARQPWIIIGFAIVAPLSCFRKLDALKYTSGISVMFVIFLTLMVFLFAVHANDLDPCKEDDDPDDDGGSCVGDKPLFSVNTNTFRVLSIFIFAFSCQTVSLLCLSSLSRSHFCFRRMSFQS